MEQIGLGRIRDINTCCTTCSLNLFIKRVWPTWSQRYESIQATPHIYI